VSAGERGQAAVWIVLYLVALALVLRAAVRVDRWRVARARRRAADRARHLERAARACASTSTAFRSAHVAVADFSGALHQLGHVIAERCNTLTAEEAARVYAAAMCAAETDPVVGFPIFPSPAIDLRVAGEIPPHVCPGCGLSGWLRLLACRCMLSAEGLRARAERTEWGH
jgi:hypothetical protein